MKTCFKCGQAKPLESFYRHPLMTDGHQGKCKECAKTDALRNRAAKLDRYQEYDRNRPNAAERAESNKARAKARGYRRPPECDPVKSYARNAVNNAIRDGRLIPQPCERCGFALGVHAHHEDYSKPFDVVWLCAKHHGRRHREINAERRAHARAA